MRSSSRTFIALLLPAFSGLAFLASSAVAAAGPISVSQTVRVSSAFPNATHGEVLIAADPRNGHNLIGCSDIFHPGGTTTVVYASFDGGMHWRPTLQADFHRTAGDPDCAYGLGGRAYYAVLGQEAGHGVTAVYLSTTAGKTWNHPVMLPSMDREYVTVDTNPKSRFAGRVYLNATQGTSTIDPDPANYNDRNGITIYHSLDRGQSFEQGVTLSDTGGRYVLGMGNGAVLSDGTYIAVFGDLKDEKTGWDAFPKVSTASLKVVSSNDGGEKFTPASVVDDWYYCNPAKDSDIPTIAVDTSSGPFHDRVYITWPDSRSGRCQIMIAHSDDKGKTWSHPVVVNDDFARPNGNGPDDFHPVVAVNRSGVVGIMWYDRRDVPNNEGYWVRFSASFDGGETFVPSVRVSKTASHLFYNSRLSLDGMANNGSIRLGVNPFKYSGGDTAGLAAGADGIFHPFWIANYTGVDQVWTAAVKAKGRAYKNGSARFASWRDVTKDVALKFSDTVFNRTTGSITAHFYLVNASKKPISGPFVLRVLSISSPLWVAHIRGGSNGLSSSGAIVNLARALHGNALAPGARSATQQLTVTLTQRRPMLAPNDNTGPSAINSTLLDVQTRVLAR